MDADSSAQPATARRGSARRTAIGEAALDLAAEGGSRAVTHHAVDDRLGIARGSTSYYYRTRRDLLDAGITHLAGASRAAFRSALEHLRAPSAESAAELISGQLDLLLGDRRRDALARYALAADAAHNEDLRTALAGCLFSRPAAESLMSALGVLRPAEAAADLISLLEGLLFDRLYGTRSLRGLIPGTDAGRDDLRRTVHLWLCALSDLPRPNGAI